VRRNFVELKQLSDADFDYLIRCNVFNRVRKVNNAGRLKMSHIVSIMKECFGLYLRREQEDDEFIDTDMFMDYFKTIIPREDWHVYKTAHNEYARPHCYVHYRAMTDSIPVTLLKTDMPDQEKYEVPHDPAPEGWVEIDKDDNDEVPHNPASEGWMEIDKDEDDDEKQKDAEIDGNGDGNEDGNGQGGVDGDDAVKVVSAVDVTPPSVTIPSSANANLFTCLQRMDPGKTHKGHVVVSNNGGPMQVMPIETAPFHRMTNEIDDTMELDGARECYA
jgi:hypothetical protein